MEVELAFGPKQHPSHKWKWEKNSIHTPPGKNLEPMFKDVKNLNCDRLRDLMRALVDSNKQRGKSYGDNDAHVIQTILEYML